MTLPRSAARRCGRSTCPARPSPRASCRPRCAELIALAEAYPALKANQNFLKLQDQLAELEDQLQMARRYYNGAARDFNIAIQSFPDVLVARTAGFAEAAFFQIDDGEAVLPAVNFQARQS